MALIQYGPAIAKASGRIGDIVFTNSIAGPTIRATSQPTQPDTPAQVLIKTVQATLAKDWSATLNPSQRNAWSALALTYPRLNRLGLSFHLTGFQLFVASNQALKAAGQAYILDAPVTYSAGSPGPITITWDPVAQTITVNPTVQPGPHDVPVWWASKPATPGLTKVKSKLRKLGHGTPGGASPWDITTDWEAKFGIPASGAWDWIQIQYTDSTSGAQGTSAIAQFQFA
jgi:hypothetical protein